MSQVMPIEEVGLDDQGHLFVRPSAASADEFAYIYRAAMGIRWNTRLRAFHAYEPARWVAADLYRQIVSAVHGEYGVRLQSTSGTVWTRIPVDLRESIESIDQKTTTD